MIADFLQHANAIWGSLGVWLVAVIVRYIVVQEDRHSAKVQLATALLVFFLFDTALRWRVWWFFMPGTGYRLGWILPVTTAGATLGMICLSRVLSPQKWGLWRWIIPLLIAAAAIGWSQFLV